MAEFIYLTVKTFRRNVAYARTLPAQMFAQLTAQFAADARTEPKTQPPDTLIIVPLAYLWSGVSPEPGTPIAVILHQQFRKLSRGYSTLSVDPYGFGNVLNTVSTFEFGYSLIKLANVVPPPLNAVNFFGHQ